MPRARSPKPPWFGRKGKTFANVTKRRKIVKDGLAPAGDKQSLRDAATRAILSHPITRIAPRNTMPRQ